jgi:hypothetical protein
VFLLQLVAMDDFFAGVLRKTRQGVTTWIPAMIAAT